MGVLSPSLSSRYESRRVGDIVFSSSFKAWRHLSAAPVRSSTAVLSQSAQLHGLHVLHPSRLFPHVWACRMRNACSEVTALVDLLIKKAIKLSAQISQPSVAFYPAADIGRSQLSIACHVSISPNLQPFFLEICSSEAVLVASARSYRTSPATARTPLRVRALKP